MATKTCLNCGKVLSGRVVKTCCDNHCYQAWYYATHKYNNSKKCLLCGQEFIGITKGQRFCSVGCRKEAGRRRIESLKMRKAREEIAAPIAITARFAGIGYLRESQFRKCECCGGEYISKYPLVTKCPICRGVQRGKLWI